MTDLPKPDFARNMRIVGHSDQGGRPDGVQVMVHRGHAYIGHMFSKGYSIVDVRDPSEVQASGKIKGAVNVSRGMLEFRADPESPYHNPAFQKDKTVLVYCASGGRSALVGKTLKDFGYGTVYNIGGFKELADAGLETEPA